MKATFFQRLGAYIIDMILITVIMGVFMGNIVQTKKYEDLSDRSVKLVEEYSKGTIQMDKYLNEYKEISYGLDKEGYIGNIVSLIIGIVYYVVFQYLNKGQTIGKKLLKIRVKAKNGELKPMSIVIRALILNSLFSTIILLSMVNFLNIENYYMIKTTLSALETAFIMISAIMILYRKDKTALQDIITKTEVVKEG